MNLLLFNLATDADDPILGFTTEWINRLAAHFEHIDVITMRQGRLDVAANVRVFSVGKERGLSERRRAVEFYKLLWRLLRERRYGACFAHMMPLFAAMSAPMLAATRTPITLWYTHRQAHRVLNMATRVAHRVVTAGADSFPIPTPKLRVIGHGIDTQFFSPHGERSTENTVVQVARLMSIKHQETLMRAIADVPEARAVFVGGVPPEVETGAAYKAKLELLAAVELGISDRVTFAGDQPRAAVRDALRSATIAVNLSPPGLFDKAALESMACGVPTITSSAAFDSLHGEHAALMNLPAPTDHVGLAERLRTLLADPELRAWIGATQRDAVIPAHSFDSLIPRLVSVLKTGEPA